MLLEILNQKNAEFFVKYFAFFFCFFFCHSKINARESFCP